MDTPRFKTTQTTEYAPSPQPWTETCQRACVELINYSDLGVMLTFVTLLIKWSLSALDLELQHHVIFPPHPPWENWIFCGNWASFGLKLAWMLRNTADESDCRGVLITQKLSTADRCVLFHKTTSSEKHSHFYVLQNKQPVIWSLIQGKSA